MSLFAVKCHAYRPSTATSVHHAQDDEFESCSELGVFLPSQSKVDSGFVYSTNPWTGAIVRSPRQRSQRQASDKTGLFYRSTIAYEESQSAEAALSAPATPQESAVAPMGRFGQTALAGRKFFSEAVSAGTEQFKPSIRRRVEPIESWSARLDEARQTGHPVPRGAWSLSGPMGQLPPRDRAERVAASLRESHRDGLRLSNPFVMAPEAVWPADACVPSMGSTRTTIASDPDEVRSPSSSPPATPKAPAENWTSPAKASKPVPALMSRLHVPCG